MRLTGKQLGGYVGVLRGQELLYPSEFVVFLEFYKQFVFLNSNKQNDGTTEREI